MNRFVIVDGLPFLLHSGKTYGVRWDKKGFTVGAEAKLSSVPEVTHSALAVKAQCRVLDSIQEQEEGQEQDEQKEQANGAEDVPLAELENMKFFALRSYARKIGIEVANSATKADIIRAIMEVRA